MVYKWKIGIKADPNKAAEQFQELENTVGLTPENLLEANRDESAVLHNEFEWDDTIAAEKFRIHQAAQLIRMLCVVPEKAQKDCVPIRAYFPTVESSGYEHISIIVKSEDKYAQLLAKAQSELRAFRNKYAMLSELKSLFDFIDYNM